MIRRARAGWVELVVPVAVVAIWWLWSTGAESFYFPALPDILQTFGETWVFERVGGDVEPSVVRLGTGFALAVGTGIGAGLLLGVSRRARLLTAPVVEFLRAIPPPALIPVGLLVFGVGNGMKVLLIALACVWPILLNTADGIAGVETTLLDAARSYRIGPADRLRSVLLPAALPQIFAGMRTSLSVAIVVMVVSEMVASTDGIGFFVLQSQRSFDMPEMWSGVLLLGLLGNALNRILTGVERRALHWHHGARMGPLSRK